MQMHGNHQKQLQRSVKNIIQNLLQKKTKKNKTQKQKQNKTKSFLWHNVTFSNSVVSVCQLEFGSGFFKIFYSIFLQTTILFNSCLQKKKKKKKINNNKKKKDIVSYTQINLDVQRKHCVLLKVAKTRAVPCK